MTIPVLDQSLDWCNVLEKYAHLFLLCPGQPDDLIFLRRTLVCQFVISLHLQYKVINADHKFSTHCYQDRIFMPSLTRAQDRRSWNSFLLALLPSLLSQSYVLVLRPQQLYLHHSLVGKREDLLGPLFFQFHHSVGLWDIFPPSQQLAVQKHSCLVDHDAFPFQVTAKRGKLGQIRQRARHERVDALEAPATWVRTVPAGMWNVN